jgi:hypothetical protein
MERAEQRRWGIIFRRCGVARHPCRLNSIDRQLQFILLSALNSDPRVLPRNKRWESWYAWHERH